MPGHRAPAFASSGSWSGTSQSRVCLELCWFVYQRAPTPPGGCYSSLFLSLASGGFLRFRCHRG